MTIGIALLALAFTAAAQELPSFDVASVKPNTDTGDTIQINLGTVKHGEVTLNNTNLADCIRFAYNLVSNEQITGPDWIRSYTVRFDIDAKAPPETPPDQLKLMMQRLLAERFHLTLHRETKPFLHMDLSIAKGGPKLKLSSEDATPRKTHYGIGVLEYAPISLDRLAVLLSRLVKQPVFDRTGITGVFDIKLEWLPDGPDAAGLPPSDDAGVRPDLFHAVQAQLGLKLEISKAPVEALVIDRVERTPVGN